MVELRTGGFYPPPGVTGPWRHQATRVASISAQAVCHSCLSLLRASFACAICSLSFCSLFSTLLILLLSSVVPTQSPDSEILRRLSLGSGSCAADGMRAAGGGGGWHDGGVGGESTAVLTQASLVSHQAESTVRTQPGRDSSVAGAEQEHGERTAGTWQEHGKSLARAW